MRAIVTTAVVTLLVAITAPAMAQTGGPARDSQAGELVIDLQDYTQQITDAARRCLGQTSVPTTAYEIELTGVWANPPIAGQSATGSSSYKPLGNGAVIVEARGEENPNVRRTYKHISLFPGVAIWSVSHVLNVDGPLIGESADFYSVAQDVKCLQPLFPLTVGKEFSVSSSLESHSRIGFRPESLDLRQRSWTLKVLAGPMTLNEVRAGYRSVVFSGKAAASWKFYELSSTFHTGAIGTNATLEGKYLFVEGLNAFVPLWDGQLREGHITRVVAK